MPGDCALTWRLRWRCACPNCCTTRFSTPVEPTCRCRRCAKPTACASTSPTTEWGSQATGGLAPAWDCRSWNPWRLPNSPAPSTSRPRTTAAGPWWRSRWGTKTFRWRAGTSDVRAGPQSGVAPLQGASFILAEAAPHARVLTGFQCPPQTLVDYRAASAHGLCFLDLDESRSGVADREEQLRVFVTAGCLVAPVHA